MIVYVTTNVLNGKEYVGKDVKNDPNYLGSGIVLNYAIKKYGRSNFKKTILEHCDNLKSLNECEIFWINEKHTLIPQGYNLTKGGDGGDTTTFNPNREAIIQNRTNILRSTIFNTKKFSDAIKNGKTGAYTLSEKCHQSKKDEHKLNLSLAATLYWENNREKMLEATKRGGISRRKNYLALEKHCLYCDNVFETIKHPSKERNFCSKTCSLKHLHESNKKKK
jgi:hypothetical protein